MISCLNNLVGVRGLAGYENPDWTYINDLQGISTQQLEDISDEDDHYEPRLAWDDIYNRSARLLETDIRLELKKYFKGYSNIDNIITGQYYNTKEPITSTGQLSGKYFDFGYESKNKTFNVDSIDIYLESDTIFSIEIYDVIKGTLLDSFTFSGTAGDSKYRILKKYPIWKYPKIFIGYDEDLVSTIKVSDYEYGNNVSMTNARFPKSNVSTTTKSQGDTGLIITYNIECSIDNFVCQRIDLFKMPFLYKLGIEFCNERLYSDRINRYTLLNYDDADRLRQHFTDEYNKLIESTFKDIRVEYDGECFKCSKSVNYRNFLP